MRVVVERLTELSLDRIGPLLAESERAGLPLVRRLVDDWAAGRNRFDHAGEALFAAVVAGHLAGVGGLNIDPFAAVAGVGRVRHVYVLVAHRRAGIGRHLVDTIIAAARAPLHAPGPSGGGPGARDPFPTLRLRTHNPAAARLYERAGFERVDDVPDCTHLLRLR